jgi:hypothetical protein
MHLGRQFECMVVLDSELDSRQTLKFQIGFNLHLIVPVSWVLRHVFGVPYVLIISMVPNNN